MSEIHECHECQGVALSSFRNDRIDELENKLREAISIIKLFDQKTDIYLKLFEGDKELSDIKNRGRYFFKQW